MASIESTAREGPPFFFFFPPARPRRVGGDGGVSIDVQPDWIYVAADDIDAAAAEDVAAIAELEPDVELRSIASTITPGAPLFRVAAGIDSLVPGEGEIVARCGMTRCGYDGTMLDLSSGPGPLTRAAQGSRADGVGETRRRHRFVLRCAALAEQVFGDQPRTLEPARGAGKDQ